MLHQVKKDDAVDAFAEVAAGTVLAHKATVFSCRQDWAILPSDTPEQKQDLDLRFYSG